MWHVIWCEIISFDDKVLYRASKDEDHSTLFSDATTQIQGLKWYYVQLMLVVVLVVQIISVA